MYLHLLVHVLPGEVDLCVFGHIQLASCDCIAAEGRPAIHEWAAAIAIRCDGFMRRPCPEGGGGSVG